MNHDNLIKMANQIGTFFESMPDREAATRDVANHIRATWEPRMVDALRQRIEGNDGGEVLEIVRRALQVHLPPKPSGPL
jgi:formate dehydrogenase subunit delta